MKVLLLDNYDSFTFNLKQLLEESNLCDFDIRKNDQLNLKEINFYDKILIGPGPGIPAQAGLLLQLIREYASQKPILGVCLGHQAIAAVFGAKLINLSRVYHGIEEEVIVLQEGDLLFQGVPKTFQVGLYHSWAVSLENFPSDLEILAQSKEGITMAISHQKYPVWGVQFHPESMMTAVGKLLIENWLKI